jgi:hypothetical protein
MLKIVNSKNYSVHDLRESPNDSLNYIQVLVDIVLSNGACYSVIFQHDDGEFFINAESDGDSYKIYIESFNDDDRPASYCELEKRIIGLDAVRIKCEKLAKIM